MIRERLVCRPALNNGECFRERLSRISVETGVILSREISGDRRIVRDSSIARWRRLENILGFDKEEHSFKVCL